MKKKKIYSLISKYKRGSATDAEKRELIDWYRAVADQESEFPEDEHTVEQFMLERLLTDTHAVKKTHKSRYWLAAASLIIILGVAMLYVVNRAPNSLGKHDIVSKKTIEPGKNKAILVLADGSEVELSDTEQSSIPSQSGINILKSVGGQILYSILSPDGKKTNSSTDTTTLYNTIKTPAGGQFKVVLSDGTKVWLNAMSSLKFPIGFSSKKDRSVTLIGEGYFEVHRNEKLPFKVNTKNQVIEVLGTHFNVNAYPEEVSTKTTLLEGSVRIASGSHNVQLNSGQEALLLKQFTISNVKTAYAVAWKDGYFRFDGENLENIMKIMSRWYNIKVVYENESVKNESFGVLSDRFANISTLLNIMEQTGSVKFRIDGSTVYVNTK